MTSLVVAACSRGAKPGTPREAEPTSGATTTSGATASGLVSPDSSRLRVSTAGWKTDFTKASVDLAEFRGGGPPKVGIPAIDAPRYESIVAARGWLSDKSPVISLQIGKAARAYPLAILMWHEIANDALGGKPVVVTFCPLSNTPSSSSASSTGSFTTSARPATCASATS